MRSYCRVHASWFLKLPNTTKLVKFLYEKLSKFLFKQVLLPQSRTPPSPLACFPKDIREIFELRIVLETLGVELAVEKMAPEDLVLLQSILDNSQHFLQNDDFHGYWDSNRQWHLALYKIADNQRMLDMIQMLYQYSARYPAYFTDHERLIKSFSEHQMILNACATKMSNWQKY